MGVLKHVAALAVLLNREIDLRRVVGMGRAIGEEIPIRMLMGLLTGPMNRQQVASTSGGGLSVVGPKLNLMLALGLVEDAGRDTKHHVYRITPRGRKLLEALLDAANDPDPPAEASPPAGVAGPGRMKLIGARRAAALSIEA